MKEHEKMCKGTVEQGIDFPPKPQLWVRFPQGTLKQVVNSRILEFTTCFFYNFFSLSVTFLFTIMFLLPKLVISYFIFGNIQKFPDFDYFHWRIKITLPKTLRMCLHSLFVELSIGGILSIRSRR